MTATKETSSPRADLIVVGGGLAGLSAAALVARAGRSVVVLEQAGAPGGRAATHVRHGAHFNLGPHALYCHGHAFRLLRDLGVPFVGRVPEPGRPLLTAGEAQHTLPSGLGSLLSSRLFNLREKWHLARFLMTLPKLDARRFDRVPLAGWLADAAGAGNLAAFLRALFRVSTYADDPERLSAGAAVRQLQVALVGNVWYLDGGWQTLVDGLREKVTEHGGEVRTGARVRRVEEDGVGVAVRLADGAVLRAGAAVLAVGPKTAGELLDLPGNAPLARWAAGSAPVRAATLDVALDRLPRPEVRFALGLDRPLYYSVHSAAARLAPAGVVVLHVMKYLGTEAAPAKAVERELEGYLDRLQPGWRARAVERRFLPGLTVAHALPRADQGGASGRPASAVAGWPNLFLAGDWVGPEGMLADAAAASAEQAARHALAALQRRPSYAGR